MTKQKYYHSWVKERTCDNIIRLLRAIHYTTGLITILFNLLLYAKGVVGVRGTGLSLNRNLRSNNKQAPDF